MYLTDRVVTRVLLLFVDPNVHVRFLSAQMLILRVYPLQFSGEGHCLI